MFSNLFGIGSILGTKRKDPVSSDESSDGESDDGDGGWARENDPMQTGDADEEAPAAVDEEAPAAVDEDASADVPFGTPTLAQMLTRVLPDADVRCPRVVIVGGQSSGKTKMIINLLFHYLVDNKSFTDEMGEKLLKIFRTGSKMVTRRPTTVQFRKKNDAGSSGDHGGTPVPPAAHEDDVASAETCDITLHLGGEIATLCHDEARFDAIIAKVNQESVVRDGRAFGGELRVVIAAPGLPNMQFTDLPGLITDDRILSDAQEMEADSSSSAAEGSSQEQQHPHHKHQQQHHHHHHNKHQQQQLLEQATIRKMVRRFMEMKNTTLVVVEPASVEDFETSQVSPLLRDIKRSGRRKDIFDHAVLVLSKCDRVREGFERRIMNMIDLTSAEIGPGAEFPYKYVMHKTV